MTKLGRPRMAAGAVTVVQIKLRLYRGLDDDLLAFFASLPVRLRAAMVKQALRSGAMPVGDLDGAVEEAALAALRSLVS